MGLVSNFRWNKDMPWQDRAANAEASFGNGKLRDATTKVQAVHFKQNLLRPTHVAWAALEMQTLSRQVLAIHEPFPINQSKGKAHEE